jgi:hypothetical protein
MKTVRGKKKKKKKKKKKEKKKKKKKKKTKIHTGDGNEELDGLECRLFLPCIQHPRNHLQHDRDQVCT